MKSFAYGVALFIIMLFAIPIFILGGVGREVIETEVVKQEKPIITTTVYNKNDRLIRKSPLIDKIRTTLNNNLNVKLYYKGKIIKIELEEYIKGVIAAEMPVSFSDEALKAQAVAARTFAIALIKEFSGCSHHKGADLCSEVHCQAFIQKTERIKKWSSSEGNVYWEKISRAVEATKGMVLSYNGFLAKHVKYHANSGGRTENSAFVFGYIEPYLVSVPSLFEAGTQSYASRATYTSSSFIAVLKKVDSKLKFKKIPLRMQIKITEKTEGNRVKKMRIANRIYTGVEIRNILKLKSAAFDIAYKGKYIVFNVRGYGHGVGMSQWGANEMGKRNIKWFSILKYYYRGIEIKDFHKLKYRK